METLGALGFFGFLGSIIIAIVFFIMANNISSIRHDVRRLTNFYLQQKQYENSKQVN